jgi:hypothetical protein
VKNRKYDLFRVKKKKSELGFKASLTIEAALVMPIGISFLIAFLYFIQLFTLQEKIQAGITNLGLNLAKTAYIYEDYFVRENQTGDESNHESNVESDSFVSDSIKEILLEYGIQVPEIGSLRDGSIIKLMALNYLEPEEYHNTCIVNGFDGISFFFSDLLDEEGCIDIIVRYQFKIPFQLLPIGERQMIQRVRLRGWTGRKIPSAYSIVEKEDSSKEEKVYVTETGSVYHTNPKCRHLNISVKMVSEIRDDLVNDYGLPYQPCQSCCKDKEGGVDRYFVTPGGSRYHTRMDCSKIKRTVYELSLSEVSGKRQCKECQKN